MPSEFDSAMKTMTASVVKYVQDAAVLQVETRYVEVNSQAAADFDQSKPAARTTIRLDGDSETVMPMRKNEAGSLEVDGSLFELHQQNVNTAIEYRARILNALLGTISQRR